MVKLRSMKIMSGNVLVCHNTNRDKLTVIRRTCGYLGENFWNEGRTKEIKDRVMHI